MIITILSAALKINLKVQRSDLVKQCRLTTYENIQLTDDEEFRRFCESVEAAHNDVDAVHDNLDEVQENYLEIFEILQKTKASMLQIMTRFIKLKNTLPCWLKSRKLLKSTWMSWAR